MTTSQVIQSLQKMEAKYGRIEVYFDCPKCGSSFTPNKTVAVAVHMTEYQAPMRRVQAVVKEG